MLQGLLRRDALDRVTLEEVLDDRRRRGGFRPGGPRLPQSTLPPPPTSPNKCAGHLPTLPFITCSRSRPVALSLGTTFTRDVVAGYIG